MGRSCLMMSKRIRVFYRDFYDGILIALAAGNRHQPCKRAPIRVTATRPASCRYLMTAVQVTSSRSQSQTLTGVPLTPDQLTFLQQYISQSSNVNGDGFNAAAKATNLDSRNLGLIGRYNDPGGSTTTGTEDDFLYSGIFKESTERLSKVRVGYGKAVKDYFELDNNNNDGQSSSFRGRPYFGKVFGAGGTSQTPYGDRDSRFTLEYNSPSQALNAPPVSTGQDSRQNNGPSETLVRTIELLSEITPTNSLHLQQQQQSQKAGRSRKSQYTFDQLPEFPKLWTYQTFTAYVKQLTGSIYLDRSSSLGVTTQQGIVGLILRDIFRSDNRATLGCRTTESYNAAISYFVKLYDLPPVRQLYSQMSKMRIPYDTYTFNILMSAALKPKDRRKNYTSKVDRVALVAEYIRLMCAYEVKASPVTWAIFLQVSESLHDKGYILQSMRDLQIPVGPAVLVDMTRALVESGTMTPMQIMDYVDTDTSNSVSIPLINQTMSFVLEDKSSSSNNSKQKRLELCWKFMFRHIEESCGQVWPSVVTLHTFFKHICDNGRRGNLVQALGPFALFINDMKVKPEIHTWHILLRAAVSTDARRPDYAKCIELIYKLMIAHVGQVLPQTKEWIARARDRLATVDNNNIIITRKIDISNTTLTQEERDFWEKALGEFTWSKEEPRMAHIPDGKIASFFGFTGNRIKQEQSMNNNDNNNNKHKSTHYLGKVKREKKFAADAIRKKVLEQGPSRMYIDDLVKRGLVKNKS